MKMTSVFNQPANIVKCMSCMVILTCLTGCWSNAELNADAIDVGYPQYHSRERLLQERKAKEDWVKTYREKVINPENPTTFTNVLSAARSRSRVTQFDARVQATYDPLRSGQILKTNEIWNVEADQALENAEARGDRLELERSRLLTLEEYEGEKLKSDIEFERKRRKLLEDQVSRIDGEISAAEKDRDGHELGTPEWTAANDQVKALQAEQNTLLGSSQQPDASAEEALETAAPKEPETMDNPASSSLTALMERQAADLGTKLDALNAKLDSITPVGTPNNNIRITHSEQLDDMLAFDHDIDQVLRGIGLDDRHDLNASTLHSYSFPITVRPIKRKGMRFANVAIFVESDFTSDDTDLTANQLSAVLNEKMAEILSDVIQTEHINTELSNLESKPDMALYFAQKTKNKIQTVTAFNKKTRAINPKSIKALEALKKKCEEVEKASNGEFYNSIDSIYWVYMITFNEYLKYIPLDWIQNGAVNINILRNATLTESTPGKFFKNVLRMSQMENTVFDELANNWISYRAPTIEEIKKEPSRYSAKVEIISTDTFTEKIDDDFQLVSVSPRLEKQNVSEMTRSLNGISLGLGASAALPNAGIPGLDAAVSYQRQLSEKIDTIRRVPRIVGGFEEETARWSFGPRFSVSEGDSLDGEWVFDGMERNVTMDIRVPNFIRRLTFHVNTSWGSSTATHPENKEPEATYTVDVTTNQDRATAWLEYVKAWAADGWGTQEADIRIVKAVQKVRESADPKKNPPTVEEIVIFATGKGLWRDCRFFLEGHENDTSASELLPDMKTVRLTWNEPHLLKHQGEMYLKIYSPLFPDAKPLPVEFTKLPGPPLASKQKKTKTDAIKSGKFYPIKDGQDEWLLEIRLNSPDDIFPFDHEASTIFYGKDKENLDESEITGLVFEARPGNQKAANVYIRGKQPLVIDDKTEVQLHSAKEDQSLATFVADTNLIKTASDNDPARKIQEIGLRGADYQLTAVPLDDEGTLFDVELFAVFPWDLVHAPSDVYLNGYKKGEDLNSQIGDATHKAIFAKKSLRTRWEKVPKDVLNFSSKAVISIMYNSDSPQVYDVNVSITRKTKKKAEPAKTTGGIRSKSYKKVNVGETVRYILWLQFKESDVSFLSDYNVALDGVSTTDYEVELPGANGMTSKNELKFLFSSPAIISSNGMVRIVASKTDKQDIAFSVKIPELQVEKDKKSSDAETK